MARLSVINSGAYLLTVLIWFGYTWAASPSPSKVAEEAVARSKGWNSALQDARVPAADSMLDTMDRTVERLLYPPQEESTVKIPTGNG